MNEHEWRAIWIDTLLKAGADLESAMDAFDLFYGEDELDLSSDPVAAARAIIESQ
jgi:hypothetical protein